MYMYVQAFSCLFSLIVTQRTANLAPPIQNIPTPILGVPTSVPESFLTFSLNRGTTSGRCVC